MDYSKLASKESIEKVVAGLASRNVTAHVVADKNEALEKIKTLIPAGVSIMNGSSVTLEEIGFVEYLKSGAHPWNNLHSAIVAETDQAKKAELRRHSLASDFYLGSVHALSETGEFIVASNTGSQLPHIVFSSKNLIFVVGTQKIVPTLAIAFDRLEKYVVPLENEHMQKLYGIGTTENKVVIFKGENKMMGRSVQMILVNEALGF